MSKALNKVVIDTNIQQATHVLTADDGYGNRRAVAYGNEQDLTAIKAVTDNNLNPEICRKRFFKTA